jgi:hypothetical protein
MASHPDPKVEINAHPAELFNRNCYCRTLNKEALQKQLESHPLLEGMMQGIAQSRPHLFSSTVVFVSTETERKISYAIQTIERVVAQLEYKSLVIDRAPDIAKHAFGPRGVFLGFDFHLTAQGPKLIEINTNAGGALLNAVLAQAQEICSCEMEWALHANANLESLEHQFIEMFKSEWSAQRGEAPLRTIVIVDDDPAAQYLSPEFDLFQRLFTNAGFDARIADPRSLKWREGSLFFDDAGISIPVDMVYNRLTDFYFQDSSHQSLRQAYESGAVVITPDPRAHALYADKRNLIVLSQDALLSQWGVSNEDRSVLAAVVPRTELVYAENKEALWANRRNLFFKPVAGYGSKATYRGDKVTKKVWAEILEGDFVAQELIRPSERLILQDGVLTELKFDVRAYAYSGQVQLLAARMYSGQTTNFRTAGGGFAPVVALSD